MVCVFLCVKVAGTAGDNPLVHFLELLQIPLLDEVIEHLSQITAFDPRPLGNDVLKLLAHLAVGNPDFIQPGL